MRYSHTSFSDVNIDEHPLASHLPHPTNGPSVQSGYNVYLDLLEPDQAIHGFDDFIYSDHPQISLHAVSFRDATFLSLKWPHTMTDAMGSHALLKNWSRMVAGRDDEVQPFMGFKDDAARKVAELDVAVNPTLSEIEVAGHKRLKGISMFLFVVQFVWAMFFGPKMLAKVLFIPAKTVQALKDEARRDLQADDPTKEPPSLSEADIITAWTGRMTLSYMPPESTRDVAILSIVDMRRRIPAIFGEQPSPTGPVWVQNLVIPAITHIPVKSLLANSLGRTALQIRSSVLDQAAPESISRYARYILSLTNQAALFMKPSSIIMAVSNWHSAKMFETLDFSPAIVCSETKQGDHFSGLWPKGLQPGKPASIAAAGFGQNTSVRNGWGVIGRDVGGNYWMQGFCTQVTWDTIEKEFARLERLL